MFGTLKALFTWKETIMLKKIIVATAFAASAVPAVADTITYDCTITGGENRGWIDDRLIMSVDTAAKTAMALNGTIKYYIGEPTPAKFKVVGSGKYRVRWSVLISDANPSAVKANYEAQLEPDTNKLTLNVRFPMINATNRPRGRGVCKVLKGETLF